MTAYLFRRNHYCEECIPRVTISTPEFFGFIRSGATLPERGSGDFDPARDLAELRVFFQITEPDGHNFPLAVPDPEPPSMCSECLRWFTEID